MTNQERLQANNAKIEAIQQTLANKVVTSGEIELTENNTTYDVSKYASAKTNIAVPDLSATTATESDVLEGKEFYNASGEKVTGTYKDMLQQRVDATNSCEYLVYKYRGDSIDFIKNLNTSNVTNMSYMFHSCLFAKTIDLSGFNTSNVTTMAGMLSHCEDVENLDVSNFDTSNVTTMQEMFWGTRTPEYFDLSHFKTSNVKTVEKMLSWAQRSYKGRLKTLNISGWDFTKMKTFTEMLSYNTNLETIIGEINLLNATKVPSMFYDCTNLTSLTLKNIKVSLQIGSGTSWGHLLTLESLLNTIKELHTNTGTSTLTLTMGSANTAKLADVYVKLIDITDEMRAEDEYIDNKAPFEVCESTDEDAMLITEYVTNVKNWQLA